MGIDQRIDRVEKDLQDHEDSIRTNAKANQMVLEIVGDTHDAVRRIENYLKNDDSTGQKGLIAMVADFSTRIEKLERAEEIKKKVAIRSAAIWASITSGSLVVGKWILSRFLIFK